MEVWYRFYNGMLLSACALFSPLAPLICCVVAFIAIDFLTGIAASRARAHRNQERWYFRSLYAWRTLYKLGFTIITVAMAWVLDECVMNFVTMNLARLVTGFVCGVEMWSFLENAAQISDAPIFRWLQKYVYEKVKDKY